MILGLSFHIISSVISNSASLSRLFCTESSTVESNIKTEQAVDLYFVSSAPTHCWVSYSNLTYPTLANSAYMWFLAHAISAVGTRSFQPDKTQRTTVNSRHTTLRAQPFSRTYCCWRCALNVRVSNLDTLRRRSKPRRIRGVGETKPRESRGAISPASIVASLVISRIVCIGTYSILCDFGAYTSFYEYTRI